VSIHDDLLIADFEQSYEQIRHYDDALRKTADFGFGAVVTVLAASAAIVGQYHLTAFTASVVSALLLLSAIAGLLLLFSLAQSRVYFVTVARFVNEIRSHYLTTRPMGIDNLSKMYVDVSQPSVLHLSSSHTMAVYFFSICNALLATVGLVTLNVAITLAANSMPSLPWLGASIAFGIIVVIEVTSVLIYWNHKQNH
jgi:hypothetical protein